MLVSKLPGLDARLAQRKWKMESGKWKLEIGNVLQSLQSD